MLVVTYSCEHNHPWPASKNQHHHQHPNSNNNNNHQEVTTSTTASTIATSSTDVTISNSEDDQKPAIFTADEKLTNFEGSLISEFGWFSDLELNSSTMLECPFLARDYIGEADVATIFPMGEEEESLFADLGELPECSVVFRRGVMEREEERRRCRVDTLV